MSKFIGFSCDVINDIPVYYLHYLTNEGTERIRVPVLKILKAINDLITYESTRGK